VDGKVGAAGVVSNLSVPVVIISDGVDWTEASCQPHAEENAPSPLDIGEGRSPSDVPRR